MSSSGEPGDVKPPLLTVISSEYTKTLITRMREACVEVNLCKIWKKAVNSGGYPVIKVSARGWGRSTYLAHRLMFQLISQINIDTDPDHEVSHLCHNRLCLEVGHLSFEPSMVNASRKSCVDSGVCAGHDNFANCVL